VRNTNDSLAQFVLGLSVLTNPFLFFSTTFGPGISHVLATSFILAY